MRDRRVLSALVVVACVVLGVVLVAQVRTTESLADRLDIEREEDLARILADLSTQSERFQNEITELRLTLFEFESSAEAGALARRNLERRLDDLAVLTGSVAVEGAGIVLDVADPEGVVTQDLLVDVIQELRDAGAEAIAVDGHRLVASSAVTTRDGALAIDRNPIAAPLRIAAIGVSDALIGGLEIPGGAMDALRARSGVTARLQARDQLTLPAADGSASFTFARPVSATEIDTDDEAAR